MKLQPIILFFGIVLIGISSCKDDTIPIPTQSASLTIVNAVVGSTTLVPNFNSHVVLKYYSSAAKIDYGNFMEFGNHVGNIPLSFTDFSDTTKIIYQTTLNIPSYSIQSLFLTGTVTAPESLVTTDKIPILAVADSLCAIRFINLSPGSGPVSVDIAGNANGSEVKSLSYKSLTSFKSYSAKSNITDYNFEIRDSATGNLLATYDLSGVNYGDNGDQNPNAVRNHSFTIVFYGSPGSQNAFAVDNFFTGN